MIELRTFFSEDVLPEIASEVLDRLPAGAIALLNGPMGAGKTTFVRAVAGLLGCAQEVGSPSFSIINEYNCSFNRWDIRRMVHMDLYRVRDLAEVLDLGIPEYFEGDAPLFVEWPELLEPLLTGLAVVRMDWEVLENQERRLTLTF
ncbi:MAG: hypothetical protein JPMHGGIA_02305 [Saprospiraceae bacterium]|nr:hypothetical protein [Saprospiraceae bacterium]